MSARGPASGWVMALTALAAIVMTLDTTVVTIALPDIGADVGGGLGDLQWVVNAYTLAFAALLLAAGSVSDRVGRRRVFATGTAVFTLASAACGAAPGIGVLIVARAVQGAGAALVMSTALALIAAAYEGGRRQTAIGVFSGAGAAAAALGPVAGGVIVDALDWRWIFFVNLPLGAFIVAATLWKVREPAAPPAGGRLDVLGVLLVAPALFCLNYALLTGPDRGWRAAPVLGTLLAGTALLAGFLAWERARRANAPFDLRLFRIPSFGGAIVLSLAGRVISFGILPFVIIWLQGMLGYTPLQTGLRLLAMTVLIVVIAPFSGRLQKIAPTSVIMAAGMVICAAGLLTMARVGPDDAWTVMLPGFVLLGIGGALVFPPLMAVAVGVVPPARAGMASGMANTFFPLGTAVGVAAFGALSTARVDAALSAGGLPDGTAAPLREAVLAGRFDRIAALPAPVRDRALDLARTGLADGLSWMCVTAAAISLVAAAAALVLIRARDMRPAADRTPIPQGDRQGGAV